MEASVVQTACPGSGEGMLMKRFPLIFALIMLCAGCSRTKLELRSNGLVMGIDENARITSFTDRVSGTNYLAAEKDSPLISLKIDGEMISPSELAVTEDGVRVNFPDGGTSILLKVLEKPTHIVLEAAEIDSERDIELLLWGPYPSTISEIIGECVGVVRNRDFALGIQSLNIRTLGGYPESDDDSMPSYNIFNGKDYSDIRESERDKELYRGNTARITPFGSTIQAYCRNRAKDRVISNLNHEKYLARAFDDGGLTGSRIALFGCPAGDALETIGEIELEEGLPHPEIEGVWGKISPAATDSYLIVDFSEKELDQALDLTEKAGLRYLYHGDPFRNWGHFDLDEEQFPDNWDTLKRCVERAGERGIYLGVHTLSNFITTNDPYVTPLPDSRLGAVGGSALSADLGSAETEIGIVSPDYFYQYANNNLRTVMIEEELVRYGGVSQEAPWKLTGCERGAFGTTASSHSRDTAVTKLADHSYKTFLAGIDMQEEVAARIADLFNFTGLRQISFDGLEGCKASGMGQYARTLFVNAWYERLNENLRGRVINDASNPGHYFWHIYTRMNWGEPWYAGFRESQTEYRLKNQNFYERNLMPHMLGWFRMTSQTTIEDAEWLLARAAGFDAGFALVTSPDVADRNGHGSEILEAVKEWENARSSGAFSEKQKEKMKSVSNEFHLEKTGPGSWDLYFVSSAKFVHDKKVRQPGEPVFSVFPFTSVGPVQPFSFIINAEGGGISGILMEIDNSRKLELPVFLGNGETIKYSGSEYMIRYDAEWHELERIDVNEDKLSVKPGEHTVSFDCIFDNGDDPKVKIEVRTSTAPERINAALE
jgi:hypothetical protein